MTSDATPRHIEIDLLRTLAILGMIVYHTIFDLHSFYGFSIDPFSTGWVFFARSVAILFLLLVGVSFSISSHNRSPEQVWRKTLKRGITLMSFAMLISVATYLFDPASYIRFGILHLIAISLLLLPLTRRLHEGNLLLGTGILALGLVPLPTVGTSLLLPLGFTPQNFHTLDYFPFIPWSGFVFLGAGIGALVYDRWHRPALAAPKWMRVLSLPGRYALAIYLVHQPVLLAILRVLNPRSGGS